MRLTFRLYSGYAYSDTLRSGPRKSNGAGKIIDRRCYTLMNPVLNYILLSHYWIGGHGAGKGTIEVWRGFRKLWEWPKLHGTNRGYGGPQACKSILRIIIVGIHRKRDHLGDPSITMSYFIIPFMIHMWLQNDQGLIHLLHLKSKNVDRWSNRVSNDYTIRTSP